MTATEIEDIKRNNKITDYLGLPDKRHCIPVPWRKDSNPSLSIWTSRDGVQLAQDKADGKTYNIITLIMIIESLSFPEALAKLSAGNHTCPVAISRVTNSSGEKKDRPAPTRTDLPLGQSRYLQLKKLQIPPAWMIEDLDMHVDSDKNLCYRTKSGSVHHKGGLVKSTGKTWASWSNGDADIAIAIPPGATALYVFEGLGDALGWLEYMMEDQGTLILSSTSQKKKAIAAIKEILEHNPKIEHVNLILDANKAGDDATAAIREEVPVARDLRAAYGLRDGMDMLDAYDKWRGQWQETL